MKKFLIVISVLLLILIILISCAPDPYVLFDNFVNDIDMEGKFLDYASEIEKGRSSEIILGGIDALISDLNTMTLDNPAAKEITNDFKTSCSLLRESAVLDMGKKSSRSKEKLDEASKIFQKAIKKEYDFSKKK